MRTILYRISQCTWGSLQTFAGFILYLRYRTNKHYNFHGSIVTEWKNPGSISLGMFIFVCENPYANTYRGRKEELLTRMIVHEYGHTIQSLLLGPLYLIIIGLPSFLWANMNYFYQYRKKKKMSYYALYTEKWANSWGTKVTKTQAMQDFVIF